MQYYLFFRILSTKQAYHNVYSLLFAKFYTFYVYLLLVSVLKYKNSICRQKEYT